MLEYLLCALKNLGRKRFRTILTVCGISIGVASVIIIGAIGSGGKAAVSNQLDSLGINGINISQKSKNASDVCGTMKDSDVQACIKVSGVKSAMPLIMQAGSAVLRGSSKDVLFWGVSSNACGMISLKVKYGHMFTQNQITSGANVCIIDDSYARSAYKRTNVVGKYISVYLNGSYQELKIIGIVESGSSLLYNLVGEYMPNFIYLPYTTAEELRGSDGFDQIMVKVDEKSDPDKTGAAVADVLAKKDGESFAVSNMLKQKQRMAGMLDIITLVISAVGAISLIVAGLGIMTVMLVSVSERTKEIGIKKAIGAKKYVIMLEFLFESLGLSLLGGLIGIAVGVGLSMGISHIVSLNFNISISSIIISCGFAAFTGVLFGVYPAYKAACLRPVEALRQE